MSISQTSKESRCLRLDLILFSGSGWSSGRVSLWCLACDASIATLIAYLGKTNLPWNNIIWTIISKDRKIMITINRNTSSLIYLHYNNIKLNDFPFRGSSDIDPIQRICKPSFYNNICNEKKICSILSNM